MAGVVPGSYSYTIVCDNTFFELAEISALQEGQLILQIEVEKTEKLMDMNFHFKGDVSALCDRCLAPVPLHLDFSEKLIVNLVPIVDESFVNDENIWMIDENDYELDVFHFVYESIMLALPLQIIHPDDENGNPTCDPDVLNKLNEYSAKENSGQIDPRWEVLKKLKLDDTNNI